MDWGPLIEVGVTQGPFGLICLFLLWREHERDKREMAREIARQEVEKERIATDKAVAVAMTKLAERIKYGPNAGD